MPTHPTQAACDSKTGNHGQGEKHDWEKDVREAGKPTTRRMNGAYQIAKLMTEGEQRKIPPRDNAMNGQKKGEAIKGLPGTSHYDKYNEKMEWGPRQRRGKTKEQEERGGYLR